jgi:type I restriction enzyme S subunit
VFVFGIENADYGAALLRSKVYVAQFARISDGVRVGQWDLDMTALRQLPVVIPPPAEQQAIVGFLHQAAVRINRVIAAKRKTIGLLNEQKQAIIHQAVTRGLDPTVPLKPSRIDWALGIPEGWDEYPLRRLASCENSGTYGGDPRAGLPELPVATTAQIDPDGRFNVANMPRRGFTPTEIKRYGCAPGDILVVKSSGSAANVISGKCGIVGPDTPSCVFSNFLARFVAKQSLVEPRYLFLLLTSYLTRERVKRMVSTTTYPNLRMGEYRGALLPLPPLVEQQHILETLGATLVKVEMSVDRLKREIELLAEYRTRLTSDVVTGKLDVREADKSLPALDEEPDKSVEVVADEPTDELQLTDTP